MKKFRNIFIATLVIGCIFGITACKKDESKINYMVLVNKQNKLPDDWEANVELVDAKNKYGDEYKVEKKAYEKFLEMQEELAKEGIIIELDSVTRSVAEGTAKIENMMNLSAKRILAPYFAKDKLAIIIKKDYSEIKKAISKYYLFK